MTKIKMIAIAALVIGSSSSAFAQVSATANTQATIVAPLTITNVLEMNFGNVAVHAVTAGSVVLSPASVRTPFLGVTLSAAFPGTVTAASFNLTGTAGYTYAITLPASVIITEPGLATMTVNAFTSSPTPTGTLDGSGTQTVLVGATLNVAGGQTAGVYNSATDFSVSVVYN